MTIDKAIEVLQDLLTYIEPDDPPEYHKAFDLSIEALKEIKRTREGNPALDGELLPTETEE